MTENNSDKVTQKMPVEIWSDIMCPFCYMGKRKFEIALEQFRGKDKIEIIWKSFQLQPDLKTDPSISIHEYLSVIKGFSIEQATMMNNQVSAAAKESGLEYNLDKAVVANSFRAHCLLHLAKKEFRQYEVQALLFRAYFTEGKNIDDIQVLTTIAATAGMRTENISGALESETIHEEVNKDIYESRQLGIRGVPFFLFNGKYAVSGAQEPEVFLRILQKAFGEWQNSN